MWLWKTDKKQQQQQAENSTIMAAPHTSATYMKQQKKIKTKQVECLLTVREIIK